MSVGSQIKKMRTFMGLTQKELGLAIGFSERTADIRIAQYESGTRTPREDIINRLAEALGVSVYALNSPDLDTYHGAMHALFYMEDEYGIVPENDKGDLSLKLKKPIGALANDIRDWSKKRDALLGELISEDDYNHWRYSYPTRKVAESKSRRNTHRKKDDDS